MLSLRLEDVNISEFAECIYNSRGSPSIELMLQENYSTSVGNSGHRKNQLSSSQSQTFSLSILAMCRTTMSCFVSVCTTYMHYSVDLLLRTIPSQNIRWKEWNL